jgi:hypothetical protein
MGRFRRRLVPRPAVVAARARRGAAAFGVLAAAVVVVQPGAGQPRPGPLWGNSVPVLAVPASPAPARPAPTGTGSVSAAHAGKNSGFRQIVLPDLAVIKPHGISVADVAKLRKLRGVRAALAVDGAAIRVRGHQVNVIGVDAQRFRSWTPLRTASDQRLWSELARGDFIASRDAGHLLRLHSGNRYRLAGASPLTLAYGGATAIGIAGVDLMVSNRVSSTLGLIHNVAALINAPGTAMSALKHEVRTALRGSGKLISLREPELPVGAATTPNGKPSNYIELFRASAARYCPGMSWTVLAAIGQIESGDGANTGPSTAGAEGPMQFLPSTWQEWGITAFGEPGPPNIMDPYDAVPSAARLLCAAGAGTPAGLSNAIFAYNHAAWYVAEVLALARQYAKLYA